MLVNRRSLFIVALLAGAGAACAPQVTITPLGAERTYTAVADSAKIPLYSAAKPECPYDEIALVRVEGGSNPSADLLVATLRSKARVLGGQAIVGYTQRSYEWASGTAIRFRSRDCMK
jgi:hypothetical protein